MDPFNHNDTDPLRSTDLMIAYLEDRAGEEDILKIEELLESDELYRLSMEELADQIADNRERAMVRIEKTELGFEAALEAAKTNFVNQLENATESSDRVEAPGQALPWWSYVAVIALIGGLAWLYLSQKNTHTLHKEPIANLVLSTDQANLNSFMNDCGGNDPGIGRPKTASVYSALVEQFAAGNYQVAATQFESLSRTLGLPCQTFAQYYKGQSYMVTKNLEMAEKAFEEVVGGTGSNEALRNASLWYLANLELARGAKEEAKSHFEMLLESEDKNEQVHIRELYDKGYLIDTQKYLNAL